ncbi:hypothetical protein ACFL5O_06985 [Myxococcota bacterium]
MGKPDDAARLTLVEPERMNLLGLMLASLISRRLADPVARRHANQLRGHVAIAAGGMQVAIYFEPGRVEVSRGPASKRPVARIRGTLMALLDAALGRRRVLHFLCGRIRVWGGPLALWHMLRLMRVEPEAAPLSDRK